MIRLENFQPSDFKELISWIENEDFLIQFAGPVFSFPLTENQLSCHISDPKRRSYKIILAENGLPVGHSEIYFENETTARLCRILVADESLRGKGLGVHIVKQLVIKARENGAEKITLNVYDWNKPAIRCYEKAGFVLNPEIKKPVRAGSNLWTSVNMEFSGADME